MEIDPELIDASWYALDSYTLELVGEALEQRVACLHKLDPKNRFPVPQYVQSTHIDANGEPCVCNITLADYVMDLIDSIPDPTGSRADECRSRGRVHFANAVLTSAIRNGDVRGEAIHVILFRQCFGLPMPPIDWSTDNMQLMQLLAVVDCTMKGNR